MAVHTYGFFYHLNQLRHCEMELMSVLRQIDGNAGFWTSASKSGECMDQLKDILLQAEDIRDVTLPFADYLNTAPEQRTILIQLAKWVIGACRQSQGLAVDQDL